MPTLRAPAKRMVVFRWKKLDPAMPYFPISSRISGPGGLGKSSLSKRKILPPPPHTHPFSEGPPEPGP